MDSPSTPRQIVSFSEAFQALVAVRSVSDIQDWFSEPLADGGSTYMTKRSAVFGAISLGALLGACAVYRHRVGNSARKKKDSVEDRCFLNEYEDYHEGVVFGEETKHYDELLCRILKEVKENYPPKRDVSIIKNPMLYNGSCGVGYMFFRLYQTEQDPRLKEQYLNDAVAYQMTSTFVFEELEKSGTGISPWFISLLFGHAGLWGPGAMILREAEMQNFSDQNLHRLYSLAQFATDPHRENHDMLFGSIGYLLACLIVRSRMEDFDEALIQRVYQAVLRGGKHGAGKAGAIGELRWPFPTTDMMSYSRNVGLCMMMFGPLAGRFFAISLIATSVIGKFVSLFKKPKPSILHGMGHGDAAGVYVLMADAQLFNNASDEDKDCIKRTVDHLLSLKKKNGNYPCGFRPEAEDDVLIHWCHGAPGFCQMLALAYERFGDEKYRQAAEDAADTVWKYGLLKKGPGICHGIAGNAYSFLPVYRITNNPKYLYRALKFADFIVDKFDTLKRADTPYSLWEGLSGTAVFLHDMARHKIATPRFPSLEDYLKA